MGAGAGVGVGVGVGVGAGVGVGVGAGAAGARAITIACSWAVVRVDNDDMALTEEMPVWICARVAPFLAEFARAP